MLSLQYHGLATADEFAAAGLFYFDYVTADLAPEDLPFL
jgi:hypothetical protein